MNDFSSFPIELQEKLSRYKVVEVIEGRIGDRIIKLSSQNNELLFLKISSTQMTKVEMSNEYKVLNWLTSSNLEVPQILYFGQTEDESYMLLTGIPGTSAHKVTDQLSKEEIIRICAKALRKIHETNTFLIPLDYRDCLAVELNRIAEDVKNDKIDIESFKKANNDKTPQNVLEYLLDKKSMFRTEVFTHGDYCLPNILISDMNNYGFVDWSQGGIGDIYRDVSPIVKSIRRNFGEDYEMLFFDYYGIDEHKVNFEKINFYNLIDQFTYFKKQ